MNISKSVSTASSVNILSKMDAQVKTKIQNFTRVEKVFTESQKAYYVR